MRAKLWLDFQTRRYIVASLIPVTDKDSNTTESVRNQVNAQYSEPVTENQTQMNCSVASKRPTKPRVCSD